MIQQQEAHQHNNPQNPTNPPQQQQAQLKTLNHLSLYHTYLQRYYTTYQQKNQYIHIHTNGLAIIRPKLSILPSKPISIKYMLQPVQVKGKKKKGGIRVKTNTNIARIYYQGESFVKITACVQGTVIQINNNIKIQNIQKDQSYFIIVLLCRRFLPDKLGMKKINYLHNPLNTFNL